ncbi:DUF1178 domain-containing protein [Marinicauda salina]|uniref:DUF1178 domain-containing protein n=1 Tax=Marinicauda salina TaxID=2135793 RepID=A0A2U2BS06_9PROT|nr:DUF1178 family protein [Marinicauda salina]PWE16801.1 DUF1178 domain-containing protein [Marinicauda salina]
MIRYALVCGHDHRFEAWFSSSAEYDRQAAAGLVECPECGATDVGKQIMAPAVATSRKRETMTGGGPDSAPDLADVARKVRAHIRTHYDHVGERFADEARAMHRGDKPERLIYGETTPEERETLKEEGVPCAPLPDALAPTPPKKAN